MLSLTLHVHRSTCAADACAHLAGSIDQLEQLPLVPVGGVFAIDFSHGPYSLAST